MKTSRGNELLVGLLFFGALGLLLVFTAALTGISLGERQTLVVNFEEVEGLSRGDNVRVAGLQVGRVDSIDLSPEGGVEVHLLLDRPITLHPNYSIRVADATLLGGKVITIDRGDLGQPAQDDQGILNGDATPGAVQSLGLLIEENRANVAASIQSLRNIVQSVEAGEGTLGQLTVNSEIADTLNRFLATMNGLADGIVQGRGILGGLIKDEAAWARLDQTIANLQELTATVNRGEGTLGKILKDDSLYVAITETVSNTQEVIAQVRSGEGTVGKLIYDDAVYRELATAMSQLAEITGTLSEGDGALATLLNDPELGKDLQLAARDLREILGTIRSGEGTLGQLVQNPELYEKIVAAVTALGGAIEDAREAAPINTFTTALFSIF